MAGLVAVLPLAGTRGEPADERITRRRLHVASFVGRRRRDHQERRNLGDLRPRTRTARRSTPGTRRDTARPPRPRSQGEVLAPADRRDPVPDPDRVRADRGYTSAANRALLRARGIRATIPEKTDQQANRKKKGSAGGRPPKVDVADYTLPEGADQVYQPDRGELIDLIDALDTGDHTFFVVYPVDDDREWSFAVSKNISAFGGFEIDKSDPTRVERDITTAADPNAIADDILDWIRRR